MFGAFQIGRAYGIPVRLHWTMFLFMPYLAAEISQGLAMSVLWGWAAVLLLFLSVALHEYGHALVARGRGYPVRDIVLTPIGGVAFLLRAPGRPRDEMLIAIAGPLVSVALALACVLGLWLATLGQAGNLAVLLLLLAGINMSLFLFNLIPCFPMDGGRLFRAWQSGRVGRLEATRRAVKLGKILAVLMGLWGISTSHWTLVIIAFVVYQSAASEYRQVQMQEAARRMPPNPFAGFGPFVFPGNPQRPVNPSPVGEVLDVEVSPPPYRK
jgi:Zn-dependent protease